MHYTYVGTEVKMNDVTQNLIAEKYLTVSGYVDNYEGFDYGATELFGPKDARLADLA